MICADDQEAERHTTGLTCSPGTPKVPGNRVLSSRAFRTKILLEGTGPAGARPGMLRIPAFQYSRKKWPFPKRALNPKMV
jgi:hypothetical protein